MVIVGVAVALFPVSLAVLALFFVPLVLFFSRISGSLLLSQTFKYIHPVGLKEKLTLG